MRIIIMGLCLAVHALVLTAEPPGAILDLSDWRLTLPIDTERKGSPDEISQPELDTFVDPRYFHAAEGSAGVIFRAHCGGKTTKGSSFPRCELREVTQQGNKRVFWDTSDDSIHTMKMTVAITATPSVKQHVVCAQIHDAEDDLMMVRLEGTKLFIERNDIERVMLNRKYELGTPFNLKIQAGGGKVKVWYDEKLSMNWEVSRQGCYFKAGCYTQSNLTKGDSEDSFGEVLISKLRVE